METNTIENNIMTSARWRGRLKGAMYHIAAHRIIDISVWLQADVEDLYLATKNITTPAETYVINELMRIQADTERREIANDIKIPDAVASAQHKFGEEEAEIIVCDQINIGELLTTKDLVTAYKGKKAARRKRMLLLIIAVIVGTTALFVSIGIHNLPANREERLYNEIMEHPEDGLIKKYYSNFPNGVHYEDVLYKEAQFEPFNKSYILKRSIMDIYTEYLTKYPYGKYSNSFNSMYNSLWNQKIDVYDSLYRDSDCKKIFIKMLRSMEINMVKTVNVKFVSNFDLKSHSNMYSGEQMEMPPKILLETVFQNTLLNPYNNTKNIELEDILRDKFSSSLQTNFDKWLNENFITVVKEKDQYNGKSPTIVINYTIKNIIERDYQHGEIRHSVSLEILFDVEVRIPGADSVFKYSYRAKPDEKKYIPFNDKDIWPKLIIYYRIMSESCFKHFFDDMTERFASPKNKNDKPGSK